MRTLFSLVAVGLALAGCDVGAREEAAAPPPRQPETVQPDAILARHAPAIQRVVADDAACVEAACGTVEGLQRRANALEAAIQPLDEALVSARLSAADEKRLRSSTSPALWAVQQLRSCFELSAEKRGGIANVDDCRGPIADFRRAVRFVGAELT